MRIWLRGTGEIYPEKYEWGKPENLNRGELCFTKGLL
jgi:hypothetical protein